MRTPRYAPVGALVYCAYWQEHYTVVSHNDDGTVTVDWHGDARTHESAPRRTTHRTPLDPDDVVVRLADGSDALHPEGVCRACDRYRELHPEAAA
ncbi:MAG TPA: hypothetical protein VMB51_05315 [Solirubrobacteraceae bacterium]|nr:hypothetical protein [Solirubrobacteraceae bacterium]